MVPLMPALAPLCQPPIRVFFGEEYLHYPYNLGFLPYIFGYLDIILTMLAAPITAGMTVELVSQAEPRILPSLKKTARKYLFLLGLYLIITLATAIIFNGFKSIATSSVVREAFNADQWKMTRLAQLSSFCFCLIFIETFSAYTIPAVILEGKRVLSAFKRSIKTAKPLFMTTLILITLPTIINLGMVVGKEKMLPGLMGRFMPEIVWLVMVIELILFLVTEILRITPLTILFLAYQKTEEGDEGGKTVGEAGRLVKKLLTLKSKQQAERAELKDEGISPLGEAYRIVKRWFGLKSKRGTRRKRTTMVCLGLLTVYLLSGCSQDYLAERLAYQANKLYTQIAQSSTKPDSSRFKEAVAAQKRILRQYPNWSGCAQAQMAIGHLYFLEGKYPQARIELAKVSQNYPHLPDLCLQAKFYYGLSYEYQGDWAQALKIYQHLEEVYPYSYVALQIPIHIAQYYEAHQQITEAGKYYEQAIDKYKGIIRQRMHPQLVVAAEDLLTSVYENQKKPYQLIEILEGVIKREPGSLKAANALYKLAGLYETLHQPQRALNEYSRFVQQYPEHEFASIARNKIEALKLTLQGAKIVEK